MGELNSLRKYLIDYFYDTIPQERLLISLNIIDNIILKNMIMIHKKLIMKFLN